MSTEDENIQSESAEADDENIQSESAEAGIDVESPVLPEIDEEDTEDSTTGVGGSIILFFMIGLFASLVIGWVIFPKLLYSKKNQPVAFNHALHMEHVADGCESCHFFREDGSYAGIPKNEQCIECHQDPQGVNPDEIYYITEYIDKNREVPWLVYSRQPDCVFFSHAAHVKAAKIACEECHGPYEEMTSLKPYYENRISGYSRDIWGKNIAGIKRNPWDRMKMDDCDECHRREAVKITSVQTAKDGCFVCHK